MCWCRPSVVAVSIESMVVVSIVGEVPILVVELHFCGVVLILDLVN